MTLAKVNVMSSSGEVTRLLQAIAKGNRRAQEELIPLVYDELRRIAAVYMRKERPDHTLQATALVHEAYLKLVSQRTGWKNRSHFIGVAAKQMRRLLVDYARRRQAEKRAAGLNKVQFEDALAMARERPAALVALDEALERFGQEYGRKAQVVELRFFGGQTEEEIAVSLEISEKTVRRDWEFARAWLAKELLA